MREGEGLATQQGEDGARCKHNKEWTDSQHNKEKENTSLGSMVQKGKFSAGMEQLVRQLYSVLLPTFGSPTMPTCPPTTQSLT